MSVLNESILANPIKLYFLILTSNVGKRKGSRTDRCYSRTCRIWKTVEQGAKMRGQRSWGDLNFLWMYLRAHTIFLIYFIWNILLLSLAFERSAPLIKLPTRLVWDISPKLLDPPPQFIPGSTINTHGSKRVL